jgi:hypothetical protein
VKTRSGVRSQESYRKERPLSGVFFSAPLTSKNKYKKWNLNPMGGMGIIFLGC